MAVRQSPQTASTNWTDHNRFFCSAWELDSTDLMPTCTSSSMASLRCAHAMQTSWLQNTCCSTVDSMMLWGGTCDLNRRYWGTSCMATWRSWGGQPPSWGQQSSPSSVRRRRRQRPHSNSWSLPEMSRQSISNLENAQHQYWLCWSDGTAGQFASFDIRK